MVKPLQQAEEYPFEETFAELAILLATFIVYYGISYVMKKWIQGTDDYMVAGRTIGPFVNGSAIFATWESLATFMGVALMLTVQIPFLAVWTDFFVDPADRYSLWTDAPPVGLVYSGDLL